jgi:orotidine-5'-phosphate decarboxylase
MAGTMRIAAVTVLTSHGPDGYWEILGRAGEGSGLGDEVVRLARLAVRAGAGAVVASPREVAAVRQAVGQDPWIVTPGIRPAGSAADDHQRAATPREAVTRGATHLVIGRPILRADDPAAVYQQLCEEVS